MELCNPDINFPAQSPPKIKNHPQKIPYISGNGAF